ncbi:MAG: hypothetical protein ACQEXI_01055 [Pseudomonadota bacterium]
MLSNIEQVRLNIGDTNTEDQYLEDSVIQFLLDESGSDVLDASIEALEAIINQLSLTPDRWRIGDVEEYRASIDDLEGRLQELKNKRNAKKFTAIPILFNTDRKDWSEFTKIFGDD